MNATGLDRLRPLLTPRAGAWFCLLAFASTAAPLELTAADHRGRATVCSTVSAGYSRTPLADGSFRVERYAFGNGGCTAGYVRDESIDALPFLAIAAELVDPLASVGYVSSKDPNATELLIMVHWGTTVSPSEAHTMPLENGPGLDAKQVDVPKTCRPGGDGKCVERLSPTFDRSQQASGSASMMADFQNQVRDRINLRNAHILGFDDEFRRLCGAEQRPAIQDMSNDLLSDLEDSRYFVVLVAYDFQKAWKTKELEILWTTRFSLRTRSNRFDQQLAGMTKHASRFFGADSQGLVRSYLPSSARVNIGPTETLGEE